ncbi:hypothetical protein GGP84_001635 [Salinibacter ruber]|nr:hypothetical protein [Salinibacter ruber]
MEPAQLSEQDCSYVKSYVKQVRFTEYRLPLDILNIGNLIFKPYVASERNVAASTQNQSVNALTERT